VTLGLMAAVIGVALLTSALSGVLGMGGGMILMAFLAAVLPVTTAMVLHGLIQAVANGSRCILLFRHIVWRPLGYFVIGTGFSVLVFYLLVISTESWLVFLAMGVLPFLPKAWLKGLDLDFLKNSHALSCGFVVSLMQLLAGVSGPLLDMFFQESRLSRHEIIATKAITQTLGHSIKIAVYLPLVGSERLLPDQTIFVLLLLFTTLLGTWCGTRILDRMNDNSFRIGINYGIKVVGLVCIFKGLSLSFL
jgi:uncharacterized membrane protein YfcA